MWSELFFEKFVIFVVRVATNVFGRIATIVIGVATILFFFCNKCCWYCDNCGWLHWLWSHHTTPDKSWNLSLSGISQLTFFITEICVKLVIKCSEMTQESWFWHNENCKIAETSMVDTNLFNFSLKYLMLILMFIDWIIWWSQENTD